jgi:membrane protein DedA with SNARE-associated domain
VRHIVAIFAGTSGLPMWEFSLFAYTGGFIWTSFFLTIGYFFGKHSRVVIHTINHNIIMISVAVCVILILVYIGKMIINKSEKDKKK